MFDQIEMMRVVEKYRGDAVVIPAYRADPAWAKVSTVAPDFDTTRKPLASSLSGAST